MSNISYHTFSLEKETDFEEVRNLIGEDLSEPYSVYVYRFFLDEWPELCYIARDENGEAVGTIISKLEPHRGVRMRGYIGMLAVKEEHRGKGIAKNLVNMSIDLMIEKGAHEITLETEVINQSAINLYESLGFIRSKRLHCYYINQHDAFRLILPVTDRSFHRSAFLDPLPQCIQ